jgi:hypothetical protein
MGGDPASNATDNNMVYKMGSESQRVEGKEGIVNEEKLTPKKTKKWNAQKSNLRRCA